ncbi:hypothetical protein DYB38_012714, partial [Aphanomyces astaci]
TCKTLYTLAVPTRRHPHSRLMLKWRAMDAKFMATGDFCLLDKGLSAADAHLRQQQMNHSAFFQNTRSCLATPGRIARCAGASCAPPNLDDQHAVVTLSFRECDAHPLLTTFSDPRRRSSSSTKYDPTEAASGVPAYEDEIPIMMTNFVMWKKAKTRQSSTTDDVFNPIHLSLPRPDISTG